MGVIPNPKMAFIFPISCILALIFPILIKYFPKCVGKGSFPKSQIKSLGSGDIASVERNHLCNFERGHHREHSCEVILYLNQWFRRRCRLKKKFTHDRRMDDLRQPDLA